jgi:hypothetical protein
LSRAIYESGGAPSDAVAVSLRAWHVVHDLWTRSRPALAFPAFVVAEIAGVARRSMPIIAKYRENMDDTSLIISPVDMPDWRVVDYSGVIPR